MDGPLLIDAKDSYILKKYGSPKTVVALKTPRGWHAIALNAWGDSMRLGYAMRPMNDAEEDQ